MQTYRGVVCEKKNKYMVFLTEKGEFLRGIPTGNPPEIGEESEFTLVSPSFITKGKAKPRFVAAVLVAAAILFFFMSSLGSMNEKVRAYVQLDAGTPMEFGVNRKGNVISLRYLNETPNEPATVNGWEGHSLHDVLDKAVLGLSDFDERVIITTIYPSDKSGQDTRHLIGNAVQEVRTKHDELNWDIGESTPEERKVANKKKMSIHQFKSIESEKEKLPVKHEDPVKKKPVKQEKDALQKPKKETAPPEQPQQKRVEKEKEKGLQNPPTEKNEKKPDTGQSEKVPPHAEKKGPPANSPSLDKQNKGNQDSPVKQQKENPSKEKKQNTHNEK